VIPLTREALILREKKNKRKTMMNNITNTMCRLSDLTREQANSLVAAMPDSVNFDFGNYECFIGFTIYGTAGTWRNANDPKIISYTEMMQLLGKDMNKQTAQEQIAVMQIEMDKLKAIINKPEAKTGRVMSVSDLQVDISYWAGGHEARRVKFKGDSVDKGLIESGVAFHDKETAEKHIEYLKLEQELRRAQIADGCVTAKGSTYTVVLFKNTELLNQESYSYHERISFNTIEARDRFRNTHTDEQLTLLIRGV
jgi:hypothetical protein